MTAISSIVAGESSSYRYNLNFRGEADHDRFSTHLSAVRRLGLYLLEVDGVSSGFLAPLPIFLAGWIVSIRTFATLAVGFVSRDLLRAMPKALRFRR